MKELREKAAKLLADARAILDRADTESRGLTPEELDQHDRIMADFDATRETLQRADRLAAAEAAIASPGPQAGRETADSATRITTASPEYRDAFWASLRSGTPIAPEHRAMALSPDSSGGYLVPDDFRRQLTMALNADNVMRGLATVFTTSSGVLSVPVVSAHGSASWKAEAVAYVESDETFTEVTLSAYKATSLIKVSEEMLNDSAFDLPGYIATEMGRRLATLEETAFVVGTGSGQPTGVVGGSTVGTTAAATNAITADELMDTHYALARQYRARGSWLMHDTTIKAVRKLVTGVSGDKTYLWAPGLQAGEPDRLLGRPVFASNDMAEIATSAKVALFGDFSYYYIGDRAGITLQRLNELYAGNGQVGFRVHKRTDGKLALATAVYHLLMHA